PVRDRNGDAPLALFRRVVNGVERAELHLRIVLAQHLGDRRRQRRLAMINVTDRPNVHVRLTALEFLLGHLSPLLNRIRSDLYRRLVYLAALPVAFSTTSCAIEDGASA